MNTTMLLLVRAAIYILLGLAIIIVSFLLIKSEKEGKIEKIVTDIILALVSVVLIAEGIANIYYSFSPKTIEKELTFDSASYRLGFEISGSFSDEQYEYVLAIPVDVGKKYLDDGRLIENHQYRVIYDERADVVYEIYDLSLENEDVP